MSERVEEVKQDSSKWIVRTNNNEFIAPNIIIAGGVGSFEPRKLTVKGVEKFEGKSVFYSVKNKEEFINKNISIFGGGLCFRLGFRTFQIFKITLIIDEMNLEVQLHFI